MRGNAGASRHHQEPLEYVVETALQPSPFNRQEHFQQIDTSEASNQRDGALDLEIERALGRLLARLVVASQPARGPQTAALDPPASRAGSRHGDPARAG